MHSGRFSRLAAAAVVLVAGASLAGWALGAPALTRVTGPASMEAAAGLILIGAALGLRLRRAGGTRPAARTVSNILAILGGAIGLFSLAEYAFGWPPGSDPVLFAWPASAGARMAPLTAACLALLGAAVLTLDVDSRLRSARLRMEAILESTLDAVITIDGAGRVVEFSPAAERLFGYTRSEAEGREMAELILPPEVRDAHRGWLRRHAEAGTARVLGRRFDMPVRRRDGSVFPAELSITRVESDGPPLFTGFVRDISDRKRAEDELKRSEERFRCVASATSDVIWDWDVDADTVWWSEGVQTVFGYDQKDACADAMWWSRTVEPEDLPRVTAGMQGAMAGRGDFWQDEYRVRRADGSIAQVQDRGYILRDASGRGVRMIGATVDATHRRVLEDQLRQAQKMEAVGQLAGGVAHDFNNLLTTVLGYAALLEKELQNRPALVEHVAEIRKGGERAASLTRQLLAFSRRQVLEPRVLDLNEVVRGLDGMLQRLIGENVDLVASLDPAAGRVLADFGQMEQVIVNLVVNSRDAMPDGGKATIETRNVELDEAYAVGHPGARAGAHVMLAVSDTGTGMDAATRIRIFEPFFTTKGKDKGTGLGLSTVYGIVKQSGGSVYVYSELGKGTTVKVYLPRTEEAAARAEPRRAEPASAATETILLVEDDASLRKLTRIILAGLGYTVLEASHGEEALDLAARRGPDIQLVLTDVVMPGIGGTDLARRLREAAPGAAVVFMSGYTDDAIVRHKLLEPGTAFLQKPFTPASLAAKLREVLNRSGS